jgi:hypothetical protein
MGPLLAMRSTACVDDRRDECVWWASKRNRHSVQCLVRNDDALPTSLPRQSKVWAK